MNFGVVNVKLTAIATEYKNRELIGDEIAPSVKTPTTNFNYTVWNKENNFTVPETAVGKTGKFNSVEFSGGTEKGSVKNHGLSTSVSQQDIDDFSAVGDSQLLARNTQSLRNIMLLRREVQIANMVQDKANYSASKDYVANNSWVSANYDPLKDIEDAIESAVVPFNRMWFSSDSWLAFKRNLKVIARLFPYSKSSVASIKEEDIAAELGLDKVIVGKGRFNTALPGQTPILSRAFDASAGLYVFNEQTLINSEMNFITQVYLPQKEGGDSFGRLGVVPKKLEYGEFGMGGVQINIGEQLDIISQGKDLGYLFKNTTAK